jgi:hypothetical protein
MPIFRGMRQNRSNTSSNTPRAPHPFDAYASKGTLQPPRPNPAAKFAPKPNNPQTVKRGNELGQGYESAKATHDTYMERANNAQNPQDRARHLKQADEMKRVMGGIDSDIKANAPKGDIWRQQY